MRPGLAESCGSRAAHPPDAEPGEKSAISEAEPDRGDFKGVVVLFPEEWYPELDSRCMKVQKLLGKVQRSTLMLNSVNAKNHVRGVAVCERGGH